MSLQNDSYGIFAMPRTAEMTSALPGELRKHRRGHRASRADSPGVSIVCRSDVVQHEALLARWIRHDNLAVVTGKDPHPVFLHQAPHLES
jgi:hypothetical protein